jgi:hypothetical protein
VSGFTPAYLKTYRPHDWRKGLRRQAEADLRGNMLNQVVYLMQDFQGKVFKLRCSPSTKIKLGYLTISLSDELVED